MTELQRLMQAFIQASVYRNTLHAWKMPAHGSSVDWAIKSVAQARIALMKYARKRSTLLTPQISQLICGLDTDVIKLVRANPGDMREVLPLAEARTNFEYIIETNRKP